MPTPHPTDVLFGCQISKFNLNIYKAMLASTGKLGNGVPQLLIYRQVVTTMIIKATHKQISQDFIGPISARETTMEHVQNPLLHLLRKYLPFFPHLRAHPLQVLNLLEKFHCKVVVKVQLQPASSMPPLPLLKAVHMIQILHLVRTACSL